MQLMRLAVAAGVLCLSSLQARAQEGLQQFLSETQKLEQSEGAFRLVWWIPTEYWEESFKDAPNMNQAEKDEFFSAVDGYLVLAVVDAKTTGLGAVIPRGREEIVAALTLTLGDGTESRPLAESELTADARNLFAMMKPLMGNILGQFGQGMEFICFAGRDGQGNRLVDPREAGHFSVKFDDSVYKWRLPLGSLMPPKFDPETGERFPGNYLYNPFTGKKLVAQPAKDPN